MAQIHKIEAKAEIKCDSAKLYNFFKNNMNQFVNMFPHIFKSVEILEGEEGCAGNVKLFDYVLGSAMNVKVRTESVNDEEKSLSLKVLEGHIMQLYKSFDVKITVDNGSVVWCFEFEKAIELAPNPDHYAILAVQISKGLDAYLLNN